MATSATKRHGGGGDEDSSWGSSSDEDNEEDTKKALLAQKLKTLWGDAKEKDEDEVDETGRKASVTSGDEERRNNLMKIEEKVQRRKDDKAEVVAADAAQPSNKVENKEARQNTNSETSESKENPIAKVQERPNSEVEDVDWSSSSEDFDEPEINAQEDKNAVNTSPASSVAVPNSSNDKQSPTFLKAQKSQSWTGHTSTVFKENDLSPVVSFVHNKATSESDLVSSKRTDDTSNQTPANITLLKDSSELSLPQSNEDIGDVENEVRLARVTSSEIFGEMELEVEINPYARVRQANSGQGDFSFVDPFKVKNEPTPAISAKINKKQKNEPIPYSKLLGRKSTYNRAPENNIHNQNVDTPRLKIVDENTLDEATSLRSNSEIPSTAEPVPVLKKQLFSRIKRKISKTFMRTNSSLQVTKSLPTLSEESHHSSPIKANEMKSNRKTSISMDDSVEDIVSSNNYNLECPSTQDSQEELSHLNLPEAIALERRSLQLLREAKIIAEKVLSPEDKREVQILVQAYASRTALLDELVSDDENAETSGSESLAGAEMRPMPAPLKSARGHSQPSNGAQHGANGAASIPNFCETMDPCHPDPAVVSGLLNELGCIYSKMIGSNCGVHQDSRNYQMKLKEFKTNVKQLERRKGELETELCKLQNQLKGARRDLDEEVQRRCNLEKMVSQLKTEIEHLQDVLCSLRSEFDSLRLINDDLTTQVLHGGNDTQRFTEEIVGLQGVMRERDEEVRKLKDSLERCCKRVDEVMAEASKLRTEVCKLQRDLDATTKERDALAAVLECEKKTWNEERCLLEKINEKLKLQIGCLENEKDEICRKFKESTEMHHEELDCIRLQKENLECMYEEERKAREALEKKLRDCEEQKRLQQEQITMVQNQNAQNCTNNQSHCSTSSSPCDQIRCDVERLENARCELQNARRCLELEKQLEDAQTERSVLMRQIQSFKSAQQQSPQPVKKVNSIAISNCPVLSVKETQTTDTETLELSTSVKEDHTEEINSLKEQLIKLGEHTRTLEQEIENLRDQLMDNVSEKAAVIEENNNLKSINANSKNAVEKLTKTMEKIKEETKRLETMVNQRDELIGKLESDVSEAQVEKLVLKRQLEDLESARREALQVAQEASKGPGTSEKETQTAQIRETSSNKKEDHTKEIETLKKHITKLNKQAVVLQQEIENLRNKLKATVDDKKAVVEENNNLKIINVNSKAAVEESAKTNKALKQETKQLKKMVNDRDERIGALDSVVAEVKRKYTEQRKQLQVQRIQMEALKSDIEKVEAQNQNEVRQLEHQKRNLLKEKSELEAAWSKVNAMKKDLEKEKASIQNLKTMKERIESDVIKVQGAISSRMVDREELENLKKSYEEKLVAMKSQFDAQLEMNRQLAEINEYLGRQAQDRALVDKIRDSNEAVLRKELSSVSAAMKLDSEKLKSLVKERDQEISSLRKSVGLLKDKYAKEANQREELVKKVKFLSSLSQECLHDNNNTPVQTNPVSPQSSRIP